MQIDDLGMNGEGIAHENKKAVLEVAFSIKVQLTGTVLLTTAQL